MLMRLATKYTIWFLVGAFLTALIAWLLGYPTQGQICDYGAFGYKECTAHNVAFIAVREIGEFLNWVSPAITAGATFAIAWLTKRLWQINRSQLAHSHRVERAYISGGGAMNQVAQSLSAYHTPIYVPGKDFVFCVNNYGKTAGELKVVGYGFCDAAAVPVEPSYKFEYFYDWVQPGDRGRPIFQRELPSGTTAVYGRFYYLDIFGKKHSCGFINRVGPRESVPIVAPSSGYTAERDEKSFPEPS